MGFLSNLFGSKKNTTTLEPMLTDEQKTAMAALLGYGTTGTLSGTTNYDLSNFNFDTTAAENTGLSQLMSLVNSGEASGIGTARDTLTKLTDLTFNPNDQSTGLGAYKKALAREVGTASDVLDREAAITGGRFGTAIAGEKRDLAAQQSEQLGTKLADLYTNQQNRALQASLGLTGLEGTAEDISQNRISSLFNFGSLQRDLVNQKANLEYADATSKRDSQLNTLTNLFNKNVDYGLKSITTKSPSTFMSMIGEVIPLVGSYNTHKYGYTTNQSSWSEAIDALLSIGKKASTGGAIS